MAIPPYVTEEKETLPRSARTPLTEALVVSPEAAAQRNDGAEEMGVEIEDRDLLPYPAPPHPTDTPEHARGTAKKHTAPVSSPQVTMELKFGALQRDI